MQNDGPGPSQPAKRKRSPGLQQSDKENLPPASSEHPAKRLCRTRTIDEENATAIEEVQQSYKEVQDSLTQAIMVNRKAHKRVMSAITQAANSGCE